MTSAITAIVRSALPPHLKLTLLVMAAHGNADGGSIYPTLNTIAVQTSRSLDTVQRDIRELTSAGILIRMGRERQGVIYPGMGGRGYRNAYRIDPHAALTYKPDQRVRARTRLEKGAYSPDKGCVQPAEKGAYSPDKGCVQPETHIPPATIDPNHDQPAGGAAAPRSENADFHRLAERARALLKTGTITDCTDLTDRLKTEAAQLEIDRWSGQPSRRESSTDLVCRVADSEWWKWNRLSELRTKIGAQA